jgi:PAS domain S-box-containing protein
MDHPTSRALRIAGIYLAFATLWVVLSDRAVLYLARDHAWHVMMESVKGQLFVVLTAALLFALLRRYFCHLEQSIHLMRESEARFAKVFDRSPHPKSITRLSDSCFLNVNQALLSFFGYAREALVGHTAVELDLWGEPGRDVVISQLRRAGQVRDLEVSVRLKSGELRWVLLSMEMIDLDGEPCALSVLTDVTEQRRAEQEVKRWADAFTHCAHGIAMGDATTNTLIACNPAMQKLLGLGAEVLAGRPIRESYIEHDRARIEACLVEADRDGQVRYESHMKRADGSVFPVQMDVVSVCDEAGRPQYRIATVQDITERRRSEVALRESEGRLRALGDNIPGGAIYQVVLDTAGSTRHTYISAGIESVLGWRAEEFVSDPALFWATLEPADRNDFQAAQMESASTLTVFDREFRQHTKTGDVRWMHASASPRRLPDGSTRWDGVVTDITARKQIESELAASRAQLEAALSSMNDAVFISDRAGEFIHINDAFAAFHKFPGRAACGRTLQEYADLIEVCYPDGRPTPLEEWAVPRALRGESASNAEFNLRRKDTGETWVGSYSFAPIRDGTGAVTGAVVTARDITELRRAAARERAIEARFRALIEHAPDGIALVDQAGHVIFASPSAQRMFGYTDPAEIDSMDCTHPDDQAAVYALLEDLMRTPGSIRRLPYRFRHRDGHWIFIESVFSNMLHVEGVQAIVINFRDITEQRRMEDAVRAGEERYRAIVETSFDWVWEVDDQGCYTYASPRVTALLGYTPDQLIGRTPFDIMPPEEAQRVAAIFRDRIARREPFTALENTNRHQDGHLVVLETSARPVFNAAGTFCGYRGTDRDITERKRLEAQIRQSQKMEAVGRLAGGVAHDFNNILQAIFGFCDILLAATGESDRRRQDILEIQRSAGRAAGLTRQLLAFSRRQLITPTVLDLNHLVQNTEKMLRRLLGEDIQLTTALDEDLFRIKADAGNLETGHHEPGCECPRCHARGRPDHPQHHQPDPERRGRGQSVRSPPRDLRVPGRHRHGLRHDPRGVGAHFRALLHHQGPRQGHRPRPVGHLRHPQAARGLGERLQRAGQRHHLQDLPAGLPGRAHQKPGCPRTRTRRRAGAAASAFCCWKTTRASG